MTVFWFWSQLGKVEANNYTKKRRRNKKVKEQLPSSLVDSEKVVLQNLDEMANKLRNPRMASSMKKSFEPIRKLLFVQNINKQSVPKI